MAKGTGDGGMKRHHARTDLTPMPPPGPGESAPAMEVTPSQVEMEVVVPPPSAETSSGGLEEGGVMATQAMPVSPGPAFDFTDHPVTPEEVAAHEWPRRATTPPPQMSANGAAPITWQEINQTIAQQVTRAVAEAMRHVAKRIADIAAVNDALVEDLGRIKASLGAAINGAVDAAKAAVLEEADRRIDGKLEAFWKKLRESLDERFRNLADQQAGDIGNILGDIGKVRKDLGGEINALRGEVVAKASRSEVDSLSDAVGSLRGDIAAFRESVEGLKGADDARREALDALNKQVHELVGTMETFEGRVKAVEEASGEARGELEALRQVDTGLNAELTRIVKHVHSIEQTLEELKGAFRGIREEAIPEVRKAAIRAEQAATTASAHVAELLPRLEYAEGLAVKMRDLKNFMDRVATLERWRDRHSADIADVAEQVGLNELAAQLKGSLPGNE